jgi:hypothetical protein
MNTTPSGQTRQRSLAAVCLLLAALTMPLTANALPVLYDGRFYYTGGDITIDVLHYDSAYDNVLQLRSALGSLDLAMGSKVGTKTVLTEQQIAGMGIGVGDELQFGLHVQNTGHDFVLGPGDLNLDGLSHAYIRPSSTSKYYVGFEDLWGGGDRDFNDTIFRFSGGLSTTRGQEVARGAEIVQVAEPSMLLLLLPAFGLLGLKRRKR